MKAAELRELSFGDLGEKLACWSSRLIMLRMRRASYQTRCLPLTLGAGILSLDAGYQSLRRHCTSWLTSMVYRQSAFASSRATL